MPNYNFKPPQDPPTPPAWQVERERRRKQLAEIRNRRRVMYELMRKMQNSKNAESVKYFVEIAVRISKCTSTHE